MTKGIKTLGLAILFACTALVSSTPAQAATHPDGRSTTYRGWGATALTQDGYVCALFDSFGVQAGSVEFHADGRIDVTIGAEQARFIAQPVGVAAFHPLDTATFPDIPRQYRGRDGYQIMTYTARLVVGVNLSVASPTTPLAQSISVVEARCVYIVDSDGNVVFCLNCAFVLS
jgi:hypothetical protein